MTNDRNSHRRRLTRFVRNDAGNVAIMFGMLLMPMLGCIGLAIDFGTILTARNKAQVAADAAALQASGVARDLIKASDGGEAATATAIAEAKRRAALLFKAHADQSGLTYSEPDITMTRSGQNITTVVNYQVNTNTYIAQLFGQNSYQASGAANSRSSLPTYVDVYLALDISGSMGIAANQSEMTKLYNATGYTVAKTGAGGQTARPLGCVFGCHVVEDYDSKNVWKESFSDVAKRLGIQLRIDVLRKAVGDMVAAAQSGSDSAPIYRIALYAMGATADASTWSMKAVTPLTGDFTTLASAAKTIDIATPPASAPQKQNSYINEQLNSFVSTIPTSYDGSKQTLSKKYFFIVTDGVRDVPSSFGSCTTPPDTSSGPWKDLSSGRCTNAINPAYCKNFKDKQITVAVLNTTYVPIPDDATKSYNAASNVNKWFGYEVRDNPVPGGAGKVYDRVAQALQDCATSEDWYIPASDDKDIAKALATMFAQTTQAPSLTN